MLTSTIIEQAVGAALTEDAPWGDITAQSVLSGEARAQAVLASRDEGVFAGGEVVVAAFAAADPRIRVELLVGDGASISAGDTIAHIAGPARGMLTAERVALNFAQRMSGIASLTATYVAAVRGTHARIVDTRKTTPGLRAFEKHAVVAGGGHSHRFGLSDAVMLKDNHLAVLTAAGASIAESLQDLRARLGHTVHIEVEVDRLEQIDAVLLGGADTIMLDNFSLEDLAAGVEHIAGRAIVEASGGVTLDTVAAIARTGVDVISVGALTHSAPALDLGLDVDISETGKRTP